MKIKGFSPNYCYYKTDNSIVVIIEVPGNFNLSSDIQYSGEYAIIKLDGRKEKDAISINQKNVFYTEREFGNFCNVCFDVVILYVPPMFKSINSVMFNIDFEMLILFSYFNFSFSNFVNSSSRKYKN